MKIVRDDRPSGDTTPPAVWFAYSPTRPIAGGEPTADLKFYKGALQADAFEGFQQLYEAGAIYEVACWAHARRKFHEIHIAHASPITTEAIERIAMLYAIEAEIRGITPEIRKTIRQARARPLLDSMRNWFEPCSPSSPASRTRRRRSATSPRDGRPSPAMSRMANSR